MTDSEDKDITLVATGTFTTQNWHPLKTNNSTTNASTSVIDTTLNDHNYNQKSMDNVGALECKSLNEGNVELPTLNEQATNPSQPSQDENLEETLDIDVVALNDELKAKCASIENSGKSDNAQSKHADKVETSHVPLQGNDNHGEQNIVQEGSDMVETASQNDVVIEDIAHGNLSAKVALDTLDQSVHDHHNQDTVTQFDGNEADQVQTSQGPLHGDDNHGEQNIVPEVKDVVETTSQNDVVIEDIAHGNDSPKFALQSSAKSVYDHHNQQLDANEADNTAKADGLGGRQIAVEASIHAIESSDKGKDFEEQNIGIPSRDTHPTNNDKNSIDGQHHVNTAESNIMDKVDSELTNPKDIPKEGIAVVNTEELKSAMESDSKVFGQGNIVAKYLSTTSDTQTANSSVDSGSDLGLQVAIKIEPINDLKIEDINSDTKDTLNSLSTEYPENIGHNTIGSYSADNEDENSAPENGQHNSYTDDETAVSVKSDGKFNYVLFYQHTLNTLLWKYIYI